MTARINKLGFTQSPVQGGQGSQSDDREGIAIGEDATSTGQSAVAIGPQTLASGEASVGIGASTEVATAFAFAFGDRDVLLDPNREIRPADDAADVTFSNVQSTAAATSGDLVGYTLDVGGQTVLSVRADADGSGGVTNPRALIPVDLSVSGSTTAVDTEVTGVVDLQDGASTSQFLLDATASPPLADWQGNPLSNVGEASVDALSGDLVGRTEPVDNIDGNLYVTEAGAADPTQHDGDVWVEVDTSGA